MRQKVPRFVHQIDHRRSIRHGDVDVEAEDQQRARELLQLLDDVLVAFAGRDDLIHPARERMRAGGGDAQPDALGGVGEIAPRADDFFRQLLGRRADFGTDLDDRLVHFPLDLIAEGGRARLEQLGDVRAQLPRVGIHDLELFLDADREGVIHDSCAGPDRFGGGHPSIPEAPICQSEPQPRAR